MRLKGKTAIVTGAAGTLGAATARRFLAEGAQVAMVDRDAQTVAALADAIGSDAAFPLTADVTLEADTKHYVSQALERFGTVDVLFNNAGIAGPVVPLDSLSATDFDAVMAVNVRGVFLGLKHLLPVMSDGGSVIVTSSVAGLRGSPRLGAYVASKHAVLGLMKTAALEVAPRGIRVNAINPGPIEGPMMRWLEEGQTPANPTASRDAIRTRMRLGRYLEPLEVADLVVFLASDESRMITGQTHTIDAGMTA